MARANSTGTNDESKSQQQKNLKTACDRAREALAQADRDDGLARHKVGMIVREVMDEAKYGAGAIKRMAAQLGLDENTLYRYATVAETWTKTELTELLKQVNKKGLPLSWSHSELLASVQDKAIRADLIKKALAKSLSVADLRALIRDQQGKTDKKPDSDTSPSSVSRRIVDVQVKAEALASEVRTLEAKTFRSAPDQERILPAEELASLERTCKSIQEAGAELTTLADHLAERLAVAKATLNQQQRAEQL